MLRQKKSWIWCAIFSVFCLFLSSQGFSEIFRLEPENVVWVVDFPRDAPATMDDLLQADRENGWNLIEYDPQSDTYTLHASLWIGAVSTWKPTYLQIGRLGHEQETVVIHGDVWIRPPRKSMKRSDGKTGLINRLTLGDSSNQLIKPILKIACETDEQYGILIGDRANDFTPFGGGELFVFNSVITAAIQDGRHDIRGTSTGKGPLKDFHTGWYASRVELVNANISWVQGCLTYGIQENNSIIKGSIFSHCGAILAQGYQRLVDCSFFNINGAPVTANLIQFIRCEFKNNIQNWSVSNITGIAVEMINCNIGKPKQPVILRKNKASFRKLRSFGAPVHPMYVERRSCVVKVIDKSGKPLSGIAVSVQCLNDPFAGQAHLEAVRNSFAITDSKGMTPIRFEDGAILPAVYRLQATDNPCKPKETSLNYVVLADSPRGGQVKVPLAIHEIGVHKIKTITLGL